LGRYSDCRNITNAAWEDGVVSQWWVRINLLSSQIRSGGEKEKRGRVVDLCGGAFSFLIFGCFLSRKSN
jgi:hypothetical protein